MKNKFLVLVLATVVNYSTAQVSIVLPQQSICVGASASLQAIGAASYTWSPSTGLSSTSGSTVIASPQASITYTVVGFDSNGNSSQAISEVVVNSNPVINIDIAQPSSCNYINGLYVNPIYPDVKIVANVKYGQNILYNGLLVDLKLDIYMPNQLVNYKRPAILVLHGGGFLFGNKEDSIVVALSQYYSSRGYVVYNANYRTGMFSANQSNTGKAYYRAVQDAKSCVRYIRKTGTDLGVDTSQIFMVGVSAGALTSIATAYLSQDEIPAFINYSSLGLLDDASGNIGYSSKINGVVSISGGVFDTTTIFDNETEPIYSFHGTADGVIPYYSGLVGGQVLTYGGYSVNQQAVQCGLNATLHTFYGGGHVPPLTSTGMDTIFMESNSFLFSKLKYQHGENSCAMVLATGGLQYNWSPSTNLSNPSTDQLVANPNFLTNYTLTTTNSNGCSAQSVVAIKSALALSLEIKIDTLNNHLNLYLVASGGQNGYSFLWSNGSINSVLNHAAPGTYSVTVTSGECVKSDDIQIVYPQLIKPSNLLAVYVSSCGSKFSWTPMPDALYQRIMLTNLLDSSFQQKLLGIGHKLVEYIDLIPGTNYRFDVTNYTWNDSTKGTQSYYYKTMPCETPLQLNSYNVGGDHATIQWQATCNPESYRFKYRKVGDANWNTQITNTENINLVNLSASTTYEYFIRTVCVNGSNYSKRSSTGSFTTGGLKIENAAYKIKSDIQVFPNPSSGTFTILASLPDHILTTEIEIVNSLGQIIYRKNVRLDDGNLDESISLNNNLSNGVYEIRVGNGNDYLKSRMIVRK